MFVFLFLSAFLLVGDVTGRRFHYPRYRYPTAPSNPSPSTGPFDFANDPEGAATKFLQTFGYGDENNPDPVISGVPNIPLFAYQMIYNLQPSGLLDTDTTTEMEKPRCGRKDNITSLLPSLTSTSRRRRRRQVETPSNFVLSGPTWTTMPVTWSVTGQPVLGGITNAEATAIFERSFAQYAAVSCLTTQQVAAGQGDIRISFPTTATHGDGANFDGASGVLAHAFDPGTDPLNGDVHFDPAETYSLDCSGINLEVVALHEIGHSLGLDHSDDPNSILYASYQCAGSSPTLTADDIAGIQAIYGVCSSTTSSTTTTTTTATTTTGSTTTTTPTTTTTAATTTTTPTTTTTAGTATTTTTVPTTTTTTATTNTNNDGSIFDLWKYLFGRYGGSYGGYGGHSGGYGGHSGGYGGHSGGYGGYGGYGGSHGGYGSYGGSYRSGGGSYYGRRY